MNVLIDVLNKKIISKVDNTTQKLVEMHSMFIICDIDSPKNSDGVFRELTINEIKKVEIEYANKIYNQSIKVLRESIPIEEEKTFAIQRAEAYSWLLDNNVETPFIDGILESREKYKDNKAGLVDKIIEKSKYLSKEVGKRTGARQDIEDKLEG